MANWIEFSAGYNEVPHRIWYMRKDAQWMSRVDDRILEFLAEEGPHPPSKMAADDRLRFGAEYIGRRCRNYLVPYGLVTPLGNGVYAISESGEAYLAGELDASKLEEAAEEDDESEE